jgi:peptidoglycan hydrolase-like protein with peptidoglycan-binding domain
VRYGGGYWYWHNGWWYPAYGFDPFYNRYVYDGPIFGFGYVSPGDVTAEVQRALAARGYYYGPIDGILGPRTRGAIERYQANRGLVVTAAIDEPTLASLGLT